jgi:hypothetical protein
MGLEHTAGRRRHQGGQVIGKTDRDAAAVVDRPISVKDFMATGTGRSELMASGGRKSPRCQESATLISSSP